MDYNDNFGTPQQYMARFGVKKSTFYMQVRRDIIVFTKRGVVDFGASQRNLRAAGRPLKSNARKRIKVGWTVCHDEWVELNQVHRKYQKKGTWSQLIADNNCVPIFNHFVAEIRHCSNVEQYKS